MAAPLELKILAVLRVLGRGYCFDGVEELTLISAEVLRVFFRKWCTLFARENFSKYCNHPKTEEEIAETVFIYTKLGLRGCVALIAYILGGTDARPDKDLSNPFL
jgi:hypothetical protein